MSSNQPQSQKMVVYKARDGQEVQLTIDIVRNFLVTGRKELVTLQEFVYFMGVCKSRGLNPFAKDCYLIKYTENDPAAIITSIDFYRSRARAQTDCTGWEKGIICLNEKTGELRYSKGLVLPGEKLVGGWFRAKPRGWEVPFELEVALDGYIKKTREGRPTQFWSPEKQATMIAKVAESQGLRTLWPDEFRGTVTAEEANVQIDNFETVDIEALPQAEETDTSAFDEAIATKSLDPIRAHNLEIFLQECAQANSRKSQVPVTAADIKVRAAKDFDRFWAAFGAWEQKIVTREKPPSLAENLETPPPEEESPSPEEETPLANAEAPPPPSLPPAEETEEFSHKLSLLFDLATEKQIVGQVISKFSLKKWEDLANRPDLLPLVESFIQQSQAPPPPKGRQKSA